MISLYIGSVRGFSGKSLVSLGLGKGLKERGLKVGYFKPLGTLAVKSQGKMVDEDALFASHYLELKEPLGLLSPVLFTSRLIKEALGRRKNLQDKVKRAFFKIAKDKDIVIVRGAGSLTKGTLVGLSGLELVRTLKAKALLIVRYESELVVEDIFWAGERLKKSLLGVIINDVPQNKAKYAEEKLLPYLEKQGITVFGVIPHDKILASVSVQELVERLGGRVLCREDKLEELVEDFSIGAMNVESALRHFRKKVRKAVITGGDRPDIQLAALETSTKCIILTGNLYPNAVVLGRADELGIPMILVAEDTLATVERIEDILGHLRIREEKKLEWAKRLLEEKVDLKNLYAALGLK